MISPNQDLTVSHNGNVLNIRVLLLMQYKKGFVFEHSRDGYYFAVGGRVKFRESSIESAVRELQEELDYVSSELKLVGLIENFFENKGDNVHEINFVYSGRVSGEMNLEKLPSDHQGYVSLEMNEIERFDVRPVSLKELIIKLSEDDEDGGGFIHLVNRD